MFRASAFFEKNEALRRFTKIVLDDCSCKDCPELIESFKKAKEDPQSNIKAIIDYLLEDAQMNVRRAKLILASCETFYSDICKLAWKNKE